MTTEAKRATLAVAIGMLVIAFDRAILSVLPIRQAFTGIPYGYSLFVNAFDILVLVLAGRFIGGISFAKLWDVIGLARPVRAALLWAALLFVPAFAVLFAIDGWNPAQSAYETLLLGFIFPMFEEVAYRGLATGILLVVCGWRFVGAALFPALLFGLGHATQGQDLMDAVSLTAITGAGGLLFGWLYHRWGNNLWPAFFLHAGLNTIWGLFNLGDDAIGGWLGNGQRIAIVAGAICLTIWGLGWLRRKSGETA